jgi:hypothetical protein
MDHQFLHLIIVPLFKQPKCKLTPNGHPMYIKFLWGEAISQLKGVATNGLRDIFKGQTL